MEDLIAVVERRIRVEGKRLTPQRRLVLSILAQSDAHLDAYAILERARQRGEQLSLATVYRALTVLKEAGMVRELHLDDEHHRYELDSKDEHSHLVCRVCGRIIEVESDAFAEAASAIARAHGFELSDARVKLTGTCRNCLLPKVESRPQDEPAPGSDR